MQARDPSSSARVAELLADTVISELVAIASASGPGEPPYQFRNRVSAHQYLRLYALAARYFPPEGHVLDWGAGNGHFSYYLVRGGYRATGFSFEPFSFQGWLCQGSYRFVRGDPADPVRLPFPDASFDAVSSVGVLEHVRETGGDERSSLREIARVLAPGGVFLCYHFPSRHSAIEWLARRIRSKSRHAACFTGLDIGELVQQADLELLEMGRYGLLPRNAWGRLPGRVAQSREIARAWDTLDAALARLLPRFCQNYWFVARKPASREPAAPLPGPPGSSEPA